MKWETKLTGKLITTDDDIDLIILKGVLAGKRIRVIAEENHRSKRTIENRLYNLRKMFKARSTAELILMAYVNHVLPWEGPKE